MNQMNNRRDRIFSWLREASRFTGIVAAVDVPISLVYTYIAGVPFARTLASVMILEGAVIMMAYSLTAWSGFKKSRERVGTVEEVLDEPRTQPHGGIPSGTPLILSAATLLAIGFLVDFIGVSLDAYFKSL